MDPEYEERQQYYSLNPFTYLLQFLALYGWYVIGGSAALLFFVHSLRPFLRRWEESREAAEFHKNPDLALARLEAIQRAREKQQQLLLLESQRALEREKEREERKKQEMAERLEKYGAAAGGQKLGSLGDDYLPLSGGDASASSYRAPRRSACAGGGCGR